MATVDVVVIHEQGLIAAALADVLDHIGGVRWVGSASDPPAALEVIRAMRPHVVLSEIIFDGHGSGLDLVKMLRRAGIDSTPVVFLSRLSGPAMNRAVRDAGGRRLLGEAATLSTLRDTILDEAGVSADAGDDGEAGAGTAPFRKPSPCEAEIMASICGGKSNRQIAADRGISPRTVETHVARLFVRCGVHNRAQLIHIAGQYGWLDAA